MAVTKVAVACPAMPTSKNAAMLRCDSYGDALEVLRVAQEELGEILSAMELMDSNTLRFVQRHGLGGGGGWRLLDEMLPPGSTSGAPGSSSPLYLLVEAQGSNAEHDAAKTDAFLERLFESDVVSNGFLAQDRARLGEMWGVREACNPSVARAGFVHKFDVSIPVGEYMEVAQEVEEELGRSTAKGASDLVVCVWGHVADGNAHINVVSPGEHEKDPTLAELVEDTVFRSVLKRAGSISAEHGLGRSKNEYLGQIKEASALEVMRDVKRLFDPHGIMNPGKYLPTIGGL